MKKMFCFSYLVVSLMAWLTPACTGNQPMVSLETSPWLDELSRMPYAAVEDSVLPQKPALWLIKQQYEVLQYNQSVIGTPMRIGQCAFERGIGTHAVSHIRVYSPEPIARFEAWVGVDNNLATKGGQGSVTFVLQAGSREQSRSLLLRGGDEPERMVVQTGEVKMLDLMVDDGGDDAICDHADWAEAKFITTSGREIYLDTIPQKSSMNLSPMLTHRFPFSFQYGDSNSDALLPGWQEEKIQATLDEGRHRDSTTWTDPASGLKVTCEMTSFDDFPAIDWVLYFENTGAADTPILANIQAMDVVFPQRMSIEQPYYLHRTNGAPSTPEDFEYSGAAFNSERPVRLSAGGGRSSNKDFPFFKVDTGDGSLIAAIGWSGQWAAELECPDNYNLHMTAGIEKTHFLLHPGERVRMPRILLMHWQGDSWEANAQFRQLIYKHYVARRSGKRPLPIPFCNTCFTRGGMWLNECNAENQISLIKAYSKLGLEALLTDAGWFTGGWPSGAGNWDPRKDAYPNGMGPVAKAARDHGMIYGLWFEPERVVAGTEIQSSHPDWILSSQNEPQGTYLLNMGLPEARNYFIKIVSDFMALPGFGVYRQDFNMDPLEYWRHNDAPDRQGITEIKYIEGLYAFWDELAELFPDSLREECSSGGRRIDLETVMRMHIHQDSDYWFQYDVDQAQIWGLSQYLPNNVFVGHINTLDTYDFRSVMAGSLCLGWIADDPRFDTQRGRHLLDEYLGVRHLLTGAWYPLLPYTRGGEDWMASQYHRPDLNEGILLAFRHAQSPYQTVQISLRGLEPAATYELTDADSGRTWRAGGNELMDAFRLSIDAPRRSKLIHYSVIK